MFKYISLLLIFIWFTDCNENNNVEQIFNNAVSQDFSGVILIASGGEIIFTGVNGKRDFENNIPLNHIFNANTKLPKTKTDSYCF